MSAERNCCREHTRAELARRAFAEAGRGLPAIEAGMPEPAGTGLSRRSFLLRSAGLALSVYGASMLKPKAIAEGIAMAQSGGGSDKVLLTVFLDGGIDSLSVLAPVDDSRYRALRPSLRLGSSQGTPWSEDERLHWHPTATPLHTLHQEGKLSVFPGIGYTGPDQSHFTSRHYWEVGELNPHRNTGWLGRLLDVIGTTDNPLQGVSLNGYLSPVLASAKVPVAATRGPSYDLWAPGVWGEVEELMWDAFGRLGAAHGGGADPALRTAGSVVSQATRLREQLAPFGEVTSPVSYPAGSFSESLAGLAAMLDAGLPIRCAALDAPGAYDTHDDQRPAFESGLSETCRGLLAFQRDLEARGLDGRVVTLVWSEFGRRPEENGSAGTDHGAGGCGFLLGSPVLGEMVGEWPGLTNLDAQQNLRSTADFRAVYCALMEQWFEVDAADFIPGAAEFARPRVIA